MSLPKLSSLFSLSLPFKKKKKLTCFVHPSILFFFKNIFMKIQHTCPQKLFELECKSFLTRRDGQSVTGQDVPKSVLVLNSHRLTFIISCYDNQSRACPKGIPFYFYYFKIWFLHIKVFFKELIFTYKNDFKEFDQSNILANTFYYNCVNQIH